MKTQNDEVAIILANRHYVYQLLQHIFGNEPSIKLLETVTSDHTMESFQLLENETIKIDAVVEFLNEGKKELQTNQEEFIDKLKTEYTYLMIGPNKLPAPPWESVYRTKERLIFQESTLAVRRAYLEYRFLPSNYPHDADDHIALELDFLAHLAQLTLEAFEENDFAKVKKLLVDQRSFLDKHLLVWIGEFAGQIQNSQTHHFYPQMAVLAKHLAKLDADVIDELVLLFE